MQVSGQGKPVILIPGLACSGEVWTDTIKHLNAEGTRHTRTLAGFGRPAPIRSTELLLTVRQDLARYIRDQHLQKPVIIGYSLGGFIAIWLAAEEPELPGKVVDLDGLPALASIIQPGITPQQAKQMADRFQSVMSNESEAQYQAKSKQSIEREVKVDLTSDRATVAQAMGRDHGQRHSPRDE